MTDRVQAIIDLIDGVLDNPTQQAGDTAYYKASEMCWRCEQQRPAKDSNVGLCAQCKAELAEERPVESHSVPTGAPHFRLRDNDGWPEIYPEFETYESFNPRPRDHRQAHSVGYETFPAPETSSMELDYLHQRAVARRQRQRPPLGASLVMSPDGRASMFSSGRGIVFEQGEHGWVMIYHGFWYEMGPVASVTHRSGEEHLEFTPPGGLNLEFRSLLPGDSTVRSTGGLGDQRYWVATARYQGIVGSWDDRVPLLGALLDDYGTWQMTRWEPHRGWGEVHYPTEYNFRLSDGSMSLPELYSVLPRHRVVSTGRLLAIADDEGRGHLAWELEVPSRE